MAMRFRVILMSAEPATATRVAAALELQQKLAPEDICRSLPDLVVRLERSGSPVALVDVDPHPPQTLAQLESVIRRFPGTRFVVLANELRSELILEAMQAGARHYLCKASLAQDLVPVLQRLGTSAEAGGPRGKMLAVYSCGGGCGATTVAVNLAAEWQQASNAPTLLVDLDAAYRGVAGYLGVEGPYGLIDLILRSGPIDHELIATTAQNHGDRLKVLLSTGSHGHGGPAAFSPGRLKEALEACLDLCPQVVVDAPRLAPDLAATVAGIAAANLLVLQLTVKDLREARRMQQGLLDHGVSAGSVVPVVNRYQKRHLTVTLEEAQRVLKGQTPECLSNDYPAALQALNFGQTLAEAAPRSPFRRDLQQLVGKLTDKPGAARLNGTTVPLAR